MPIDCEKSWLVIREWEMDSWKNLAMMAYGQLLEYNENMELSKGQQYKKAAGEKPPSVH